MLLYELVPSTVVLPRCSTIGYEYRQLTARYCTSTAGSYRGASIGPCWLLLRARARAPRSHAPIKWYNTPRTGRAPGFQPAAGCTNGFRRALREISAECPAKTVCAAGCWLKTWSAPRSGILQPFWVPGWVRMGACGYAGACLRV
jgi:hypothetical protein